jgi:hypothetical protein
MGLTRAHEQFATLQPADTLLTRCYAGHKEQPRWSTPGFILLRATFRLHVGEGECCW